MKLYDLKPGPPPWLTLLGISSVCLYYLRLIEVYPDFAGNRSPLADATLRGTIHGLTLDADLDSLAFHYYATMEAIGHQTKHIIESLNEAGHNITSVFMSGGQCKNNLLIQTISKL